VNDREYASIDAFNEWAKPDPNPAPAPCAPKPILGGQGKVELVRYLGDEDTVVDAARVSFAKTADNYTDEQNDRLLRYLIEHRHTSPLEHVVYTFRVYAPIVSWWHLLRHRVASYNLTSGRYGEYADVAYEPESWRKQAESNRQASEGAVLDQAGCMGVMEGAIEDAFGYYRSLLRRGVAREQARLVLPAFALMQEGIVTVNLHSLCNIVRLRCSEDAQLEVRVVAEAMRDLAAEAHPRLAKALGWS
jgi:thymidylate synthase (FAD)